MKLKIFGSNLRDQSKGQFVVHAADCRAGGSNKGAVYIVPGQERYLNSKLTAPYTLSIWSDEKLRIRNTNTGKTVRTFASEREAQDYIGQHF